jgi:hypothetical protein
MGGTILGCFAPLSMTGSKPFKFGIGVKIYSVVVFEKGGANR